jgi:hypothetical protein
MPPERSKGDHLPGAEYKETTLQAVVRSKHGRESSLTLPPFKQSVLSAK